jgi:hypothetical protein
MKRLWNWGYDRPAGGISSIVECVEHPHERHTARGKVLSFEGVTALGFIIPYPSAASLLESWSETPPA